MRLSASIAVPTKLLGVEAVTEPWFERNFDSLRELESTLRERYPNMHAFIEDGRCAIRGT